MHSRVLAGYINACFADKDNKAPKWKELAQYSIVASCRKLMSRFRGKYWEIFDLVTNDVPINITSSSLPLPAATETEKRSLRKLLRYNESRYPLLSSGLNKGLEEPIELDGRHIEELVNILRSFVTIVKETTAGLCDVFQAPETTADDLESLSGRLFFFHSALLPGWHA